MPDSTTKTPNPALLPSPALFDVTKVAKDTREGRIVRVELEQIEPAPNARRDISPGRNRAARRDARRAPDSSYPPLVTGPRAPDR